MTTNDTFDEQALVRRLQAGEPQAWDEAIRLLQDQLRADIRTSLHKRGLAADHLSDIEQQTWLTAMECVHRGEFRYTADGKFYFWLRRIALMCIFNLPQQKRFAPDVDAEYEALLERALYAEGRYTASPEADRITAETLREQVAQLRQALEGLPPREQKILVRHFFLDETLQTIAACYGIKPASVARVIARAKKSLETYIIAHQLFTVRSEQQRARNA